MAVEVEDAYHFSARREVAEDEVSDLFDGRVLEGIPGPRMEVYDIFINPADFQVLQIIAAVEVATIAQQVDWELSQHNEPLHLDPPA